jgi:hypothetical protein
MRRAAQIAAGIAELLVLAPGAWAQGCAMCYANAAAQDRRAAQHLDAGILTLLIPTLLLFGGVLFTAVRRSNRALEEEWRATGRGSLENVPPERFSRAAATRRA